MLSDLNKYTVNHETKHGRTYLQWAIACVGSFVFVIVGLSIGWISPMKKILQSNESPTGSPLTGAEMNAIASTMSLAAIGGIPICSYVAESYGRKASILLIITSQALCWILKLTATNAAMLVVARLIAGIGYGGSYIVVPLHVREISQDNIKGLLVAFVVSSQYVGVFLAYAMGGFLGYYTTLWIVLSFTIAVFIFMLFVPESPAYLVKNGKFKEAAKTVAYVRRLSTDDVIVQDVINHMKADDELYRSKGSITFKAIFKNKAWSRGILLCQILAIFMALNGTFGIITYAWSIMTQAGVSVNPDLQSLIIPILQLLGTIVPVTFVEKVGRKKLLGGAFLTSAVSMGGLASALLAQRYGAVVPGWLMMLCIAVAAASYSAGIVSLPTIILNDMFRIQVRTKILSPIFMVAFLTTSIDVAIFAPISNAFGLYTMFYICAVCNLCGCVLVLVWLPETKGRTVDQIEAILLGNKHESATHIPATDICAIKY